MMIGILGAYNAVTNLYYQHRYKMIPERRYSHGDFLPYNFSKWFIDNFVDHKSVEPK